MTTFLHRSASVLIAASGFAAAIGMPHAALSEPVPKPAPQPTLDLAVAGPAVTASNAFGIDLFRKLAAAEPNGNLFISPYSMSVALTMATEGARGETENQMASVLRFPAGERTAGRPITQIHTGYAALSQHFAAAAGNTDKATRDRIKSLRAQLDEANSLCRKHESAGDWEKARQSHTTAEQLAGELNDSLTSVDRFDLRVANALWVEKTFDLVPAYVQTISKYYGTGGVTPLNISGDTEKSRKTINTWVEDNTENRIKDLIPQGALSPSTRLVITNAVYFLGQWASPFSEGSTREQDFTLASGDKVKAKMMNDPWRGWVPYAAFTGAGEFFDTPAQVPVDKSQ